MIINGLAEALQTTPKWLTGFSEDKEYDSHTLCAREMEEHIKKYLDIVSAVKMGGLFGISTAAEKRIAEREIIYSKRFCKKNLNRNELINQTTNRNLTIYSS